MDDYYNIKNYNNEELYNILDLNNNPTDRELEASIIQKIKQSRSLPVQNASTQKIVEFFVSIYDHFFSDDDGIESREYTDNELFQEGLSNMDVPITELTQTGDIDIGKYTGSATISYNNPNGRGAVTGIQNISQTTERKKMADIEADINARNQALLNDTDNVLSSKKGIVQNIKQLDYVKGKLNPLLKQTIKRVIYIDSKNRDKQFTKINDNGDQVYITKYVSTDFTFDLSEPLRDVVALRLYSVSIPYTFYTVNSNYGGNFFYLKGNSPGIDNDSFNYKVEIAPGFYDQTSLTSAVNTAITNLKQARIDVSFANTNMVYQATQAKSELNLYVKNYFNENDYQIIFPSIDGINIDPNGIEPSRYNQSLAAYLGFNTTNYNINRIYSLRNLPLTTDPAYTNTQTSRDYYLDSTNNNFTIIQYQGPNEYTGQTALYTITITLSLPLNTYYSRQELEDNLNSVLASSSFLTNSYIERIDITDTNAISNQNSYYSMVINLNQSNSAIIKNESLKTVIIFPSETINETKPFKIWTQSTNTGCFRFQQETNQLSNLYSETPIYQTTYVINSYPYIVFKCTEPEYASDHTGNYDEIGTSIAQDVSGIYVNDMKIVLLNGTYTFREYLSAINTSFTSFTNTYNVFTNNNTAMVLNNIIGKMDFKIDINRSFDRTYFDISFSSFFTGENTNGFAIAPDENYHLDTTYSWTVTYVDKASYIMNPGDILFTIYPNSSMLSNPVINVNPWVIVMDAGYNETVIKNRPTFESYVNKSITNFVSSLGDYPLANSSITITSDGINATATIIISITNTLTENNYDLYFYDPANNFDVDSNSWVNNLKYETQYTLTTVPSTTYALVTASDIISAYTWTLSEPTYFILKGVTNGVVTTTGENDITINIPADTYTYEKLFEIINTALANNPLTVGTTISRRALNDNEYSLFHFNINKTFTTIDYKVVFYDTASFVKCNFGVSGVKNATWDTTLGYLMGYRNNIEYDLINYTPINNVITFIGDQSFDTNIYKSFYIILDDFVQNRLNDGLITSTRQETTIQIPSYANPGLEQCIQETASFTGNLTQQDKNRITAVQVYSANQIKVNQRNSQMQKIMTQDPYIKDIFGLIPIKQGLTGTLYTEFGGTLQNQERLYFGPVNIHRMRIKLVDDKGNTVDLNNADWSFSFVCEQLYQQSSIGSESGVK